MKISADKRLWDLNSIMGNFFIPKKNQNLPSRDIEGKTIAAIIPTYKPNIATYDLIESLRKYSKEALIVIVDDSTPLVGKSFKTLQKIKRLAKNDPQVVYLRTPFNTLKAGALNLGINYLVNLTKGPQVVFTLDDDVKINKQTLPLMINALYSDKKIGAVCSQAIVKNKTKNILTRLQALEYQSFNVTKIADNGFLMGPMVMQGMLTGFRMQALKEVKGYRFEHLIEDYDITARLKVKGWSVRIASQANAWTNVPEDFESLWKQRVRWSYGGLHVVAQYWKVMPAIFQDLVGHFLFLLTLSLVALSFFIKGDNVNNLTLIAIMAILAILNFIVSFSLSILQLCSYSQRDKKDWLIKFSILPEFIYSNALTLVLVGSYLFFLYNVTAHLLITKINLLRIPYRLGLSAFAKFGYSTTWGTRQA